ncbi:hypothetical protein P170DRAFT_383518 [Aspergillus steynii IBT 23096]|uniref:Uncharacterized protein n=1 Tax=Aspergillus steynii IBT 23096 TaxID=1392250 RepID=A0A2I2G7Z6_9EURO|nr:uncharacterized protein P170DRAFT_383518 [Aspergillus steynii IBT 23096]PLB48994.1 hypothetical protein P170DRAFT_383518 [Aspergillus steynii IBT 23096]
MRWSCQRLFSALSSRQAYTCLATKRLQVYGIPTATQFRQARNIPTRKNFTTESTKSSSTRFTVQVRGPEETEYDDHRDLLLAQLKKIPRDTQFLEITEDTPSSIEWGLLGNHFNRIKDLEMRVGFNEELNDAELPDHWPLERLFISNACAEVFRSPFVLEGRVKHLVLLATAGLRFEGLSTDELCSANREAIARGEKKAQYVSEKKRMQIVSIPELVVEMMNKRWAGTHSPLPPTTRNTDLQLLPKEVPTKMTKLEIIENDSMDTFNRMTVALPHVIENLSTLNIRSTQGLDFAFTKETLFTCLLPQLSALKTLVLSVGEVFQDDSLLPTLYSVLPPNLSTLRFRGPASLVESSHWSNWITSFASPEILPNLKRLSFALDLHYEASGESSADARRRKLVKAPEDVLRCAQNECKRLFRAAEQRGVVVEPFRDEWVEEWPYLKQVDERWMQL